MLGHHWAVPEHGEDAEEKILVSMSDVSMGIKLSSAAKIENTKKWDGGTTSTRNNNKLKN